MSLDKLAKAMRETTRDTVSTLRGATEQLERAVQRIKGTISVAEEKAYERAAKLAENIDSADGKRIAEEIRKLKMLGHG